MIWTDRIMENVLSCHPERVRALRSRNEDESKDPEDVYATMALQGVRTTRWGERLETAFMPQAFSGSFDYAPMRTDEVRLSWRFAQDDRLMQGRPFNSFTAS